MRGDDDSDFLVFIDKLSQKYILNLSIEFDGYLQLIELLKNTFKIDKKQLVVSYDKDIVLYPQKIKGEKLYHKRIIKKIKILLGKDHIASGDLSKIVLINEDE